MPQPWAVAGSCRIVCVPARQRPRKWSVKDLSRIAVYVHEGGLPWLAVIAVIIATAGYTAELCRLASTLSRILEPFRLIRNYLERLLRGITVFGAIALLRRIAQVLALLGVRLPPRVAAAVELVALLSVLLAELLESSQLPEIEQEAEVVLVIFSDLCRYASEFESGALLTSEA